MTVATTESTIAAVLESVAGVGVVYDRIRTDTDRELAENYLTDDMNRINAWEFEADTETTHDGAGGLVRTEVVCEIVAHYRHDDENDSRGALRDLLRSVARALMDTSSGLVSIKPPGVVTLERPTLVKTRTGHSAFRARLGFRTWDDELT